MSKFNVPADRMANVYASVPRKILARARELEAEGRTIIHMEIGEPDFDTPAPIINRTIEALQANKTHYESNFGNLTLRRKISQEIEKSQGVHYDPVTEILMSAGVAPSIFYAIMAYIGPGDEVITFAPEFMNYDIDIMLAGGTNVRMILKPENQFKIDLVALEAMVTPKTKMLIVNNPQNPTGQILDRETLAGIADIAERHDLLVVSDEVYEKIVYDGEKFITMAALPGMKERTIVLNGFSKAYAMTGWRMGYIATDAGLMTPLLRVHQYFATCIPTFTQAGLADGIDDADSYAAIEKMVAIFQQRRDVLVDMLEKIPGIPFVKPKGAFYLMFDISRLKLDDMTFAMRFLEEEGVAMCPASAFGPEYAHMVRISYATSLEDIQAGIVKLGNFVHKLLNEAEG